MKCISKQIEGDAIREVGNLVMVEAGINRLRLARRCFGEFRSEVFGVKRNIAYEWPRIIKQGIMEGMVLGDSDIDRSNGMMLQLLWLPQVR